MRQRLALLSVPEGLLKLKAGDIFQPIILNVMRMFYKTKATPTIRVITVALKLNQLK